MPHALCARFPCIFLLNHCIYFRYKAVVRSYHLCSGALATAERASDSSLCVLVPLRSIVSLTSVNLPVGFAMRAADCRVLVCCALLHWLPTITRPPLRMHCRFAPREPVAARRTQQQRQRQPRQPATRQHPAESSTATHAALRSNMSDTTTLQPSGMHTMQHTQQATHSHSSSSSSSSAAAAAVTAAWAHRNFYDRYSESTAQQQQQPLQSQQQQVHSQHSTEQPQQSRAATISDAQVSAPVCSTCRAQ